LSSLDELFDFNQILLKVINLSVDLGILILDEDFQGLNETRPVIVSLWIKGISLEREGCVVVSHTQELIDNKCFLDESGSLLVLEWDGTVHHVFVWLGDNSNQEVEEDNEDENLVSEPHDPNDIDDEISSSFMERVNTFGLFQSMNPEFISWWINVSDGVFPDEKEVANEVIQVNISLSNIVVSSEKHENKGEAYKPNNHEESERFDVLEASNDKLDQHSEFLIHF